jgi:hypothetical protein
MTVRGPPRKWINCVRTRSPRLIVTERDHETQSWRVSGLFLATVFADQVDSVIGKFSANLMQKVDACLKVALALP